MKTAVFIGKPQLTLLWMVIKAVELSSLKCNLICLLPSDKSTLTRSERQLSHIEHIWHLSERMHPINQTTASGLSVPAGKIMQR